VSEATLPVESALRFDGVWKTHPLPDGRELHALRDVTASIAPGRRVSIVGRSGSGKSTLLHLAAGIDEPSRGHVSVLGRGLEGLSDGERTRLRREAVGLVFQFFHLLPHLTVAENVALPGQIAGDPVAGVAGRVRELLERVGLADRGRQTVDQLSGGEMQRVAICRALLRRPTLLLADEPTGNLDDDNGRRVMDLLLCLAAEEGSTVVYVTHSREMAALADETWHLHSGVLERT